MEPHGVEQPGKSPAMIACKRMLGQQQRQIKSGCGDLIGWLVGKLKAMGSGEGKAVWLPLHKKVSVGPGRGIVLDSTTKPHPQKKPPPHPTTPQPPKKKNTHKKNQKKKKKKTQHKKQPPNQKKHSKQTPNPPNPQPKKNHTPQKNQPPHQTPPCTTCPNKLARHWA